MRFTHANRHCPDHPYATLTRSDDFVLKPVSENTELPHDVTRWLERYKMAREREDRTPTGKNERKKKTWKNSTENYKRVKSRKGLMMDTTGEQENLDCKPPNQRLYSGESQDSQEESQDEDPTETCTMLQTSEDEEVSMKLAVTPLRRPLDRLQPKKRWLREACLEQQLAKPLNWDVKSGSTAVAASYKVNDNQFHWNAPVDNAPVASDNSCLNACNEIVLTKSELDPYVSTHVSWEANVDNESLETSIREDHKYTFDSSNTLSQPLWNNSQSNLLNDMAQGNAVIDPSVSKPQVSEKLNHKYWGNTSVRETSNSILSQPNIKTKSFIQKEVVQQDASVNSHITENITRPTVLMLAGSSNNSNKDTVLKLPTIESETTEAKVVVVKQEESVIKLPVPEDSQKWLGALALMELAKTQEEAARVLGLKQNKDERPTNSELNYTHL